MKITVNQAASLMGKCPMFVRIGLQRKLLDIGEAQQLTGRRYTYAISPGKLASWLGITVDELSRKVQLM